MSDLPIAIAAATKPKRTSCHTSLNLLLDDSASLAAYQWTNQVKSTANALTHPDVLNAILRSNGAIAVRVGRFSVNHDPMVDWHIIDSVESAHAFADKLRSHADDFRGGGGTNIGGAIVAAIGEFGSSPCKRSVSVIDISTDGKANTHGHIETLSAEEKMAIAKAAAAQARVTINAIAIGDEVNADYLKQHIVTRDGFAREAEWDNYAEIIRRKIEIEVGQDKTRPDDRMRFATGEELPDGIPLPTQLLQSPNGARLPQ